MSAVHAPKGRRWPLLPGAIGIVLIWAIYRLRLPARVQNSVREKFRAHILPGDGLWLKKGRMEVGLRTSLKFFLCEHFGWDHLLAE